MQTISIYSWSEFKALVSSKALLMQYEDSGDGKYRVFAPENGVIPWCCVLLQDGGADVLDFEQNFKPTANRPLENKDGEGRPVRVSASPKPLGTYKEWRGATIEIPDGQSSGSCDFTYPSVVYVKEGWAYCEDSAFGDTASVDIFMGATKVFTFVNGVPMFAHQKIDFIGEDCMKVQQGLTVRVTYNRASTAGVVKMGCCFAVFK